MSVFIDDILNGNIAEILGSDLYAETVSKIVVWWSVLPMIGIVVAFSFILYGLFCAGGRKR